MTDRHRTDEDTTLDIMSVRQYTAKKRKQDAENHFRYENLNHDGLCLCGCII